MTHHMKRQLRRLSTQRPYQMIVGSAAVLVLATGAAALAAGVDDAPTDQRRTAESAPRLDDVASRAQARVAAPAPASPSASPSATPTASPAASPTQSPRITRAKVRATVDPDLTRKAAPKPPSSKVLRYDYQAQITYYYCGPAAVRNALSAAGIERGQDDLAAQLGTTEMGTNSAEDTTRVLNAVVKGDPYRTRMFAGTPSDGQIERLRADVVAAVADKRAVVANVAGDVTDLDGGWHSFPGGHYVAAVGYGDNGRTVRIADSADPSLPAYWVSVTTLANWIATRGYSA
ncbi:Peptidase_C39 like family protein [Micromonospora matsumotoense]|uniref:Peptidase_C39 like family protein n=1 Tax=Micromonospora matsumotoense TaxID=121616 RepID=A0A1C4YWS1_9ACTN|nr:C39 family peptidase [Micromonospora matsumotoense]SCF25148.1 Peptidase_C39 like family protein [Micromonospora matsumotoense]